MRKMNLRKSLQLGATVAATASIMVAFQNFTPHEPLKGKDGSDLFLNGALTEALSNSEQEKTASKKVALNEAEENAKKEKKVIEVEMGAAADDPESAREPASMMDEKIELNN